MVILLVSKTQENRFSEWELPGVESLGERVFLLMIVVQSWLCNVAVVVCQLGWLSEAPEGYFLD